MTRFPLSLSAAVVGRKVEQRFGLIGMARLLKLAELVISRSDPGAKRLCAVIAWGDLAAALQCSPEEATEFLAYCDHARVIDQGQENGRLRLSLVGELLALLGAPGQSSPAPSRVLFDTDSQWAEWFASDLNCPPYLRNDPATRRLFRHWCASNVTVDEVEQAAILAVREGQAPHPAVLHDHIKANRQEKIRAAQ